MSCPPQYPPPAPGDDDLYSGFGKEDVAPALATHDLEYDPAFQVLKARSNLKDPAKEVPPPSSNQKGCEIHKLPPSPPKMDH